VIGGAAKAAHNRAMPRLVLAALAMLPVLLSGAARADQDDPRLPALFAHLKTAESAPEARLVEALIWQAWSASADDEVNALMIRGVHALSDGDARQALTVFDAMVQRSPNFAEGWNKRATVYFLIGDFESSAISARSPGSARSTSRSTATRRRSRPLRRRSPSTRISRASRRRSRI
jgi:hypothetical protein